MRGLKFIVLFFIFFYNSYYSQIFEKDISIKETEGYEVPNLKLSTQSSTQQVMSTSETTLRIIDNGLIPKKLNSSPEIYEVTKNLSRSYLNKDMFSYHAYIDMDSYYYSADNYAIFLLDPIWKRIIYSNTSNNDIRSYGDNTGDYRFGSPNAITTDFDGKVYVIDGDLKKIIVLQYNSSNHTLSKLNEIIVSGLENPTDIAFSLDNNQKEFWIADNYNKILIINESGSVLNQYNGYYDMLNGTQYSFESITKLGVEKKYFGWVLLFENTKRKVAFCKSEGGNLLKGQNITQLPSGSYINDIGMNCFSEFLVADMGLNLLHKFASPWGYICSYRSSPGFSGFSIPMKISNIYQNRPNSIIFDYYVFNAWDNNSGIRRFLPGSYVFDLAYKKNGGEYVFSWTVSDRSLTRIDIYRNEQLIKTLEHSYPCGKFETSLTENELGIGNIRFRINYKPHYDDNYGEYQQGWKYQEISFTIYAPLTATMSGPSSLSNGQSGTFTVTASGGKSPYTYSWSYYVYCDEVLSLPASAEGGEITPNAVPCGSWFSIYNTTNTVTKTSDGRTFDIKCIVTDANNSTYTVTKTVTGSGAAMMKESINESAAVAIENENYSESLETNPNPFNPTTKISFSIPDAGHVSLKVYDILGREVAELANKIFSTGRYEFEFNASNLPSGVYITALITEKSTLTKKIMLVK